MKICPKCERELNESEFALNRTKKDGLSSYCKKCQKVLKDLHYQNNKAKYLERFKKRKNKIKEEVLNIKLGLKCLKCSENHPATLDFHHRDEEDKDISIAKAITAGWSLEQIMKEIEKCDPLCSNCHRKEHWDRRMARSSSG